MKNIIRFALLPISVPVRCAFSVCPLYSLLYNSLYSSQSEWGRNYDIEYLKRVWNIK